MPIESRPAKPLPKGPRPGSRTPAYKVTDQDSLETVARKYSIPVGTLIQHNFATSDPAEINWYLRENVGCVKATTDGKNWCFSSSANPGLIYIPSNGTSNPRPPNGGGGGTQPPSPYPGGGGGGDVGTLPVAFKLNYEMKSPAEDFGWVRLMAVLGIDGTIKPKSGTPLTGGFTPDTGKMSMEVAQEIWAGITGAFKVGMTLDDLATIVDAIKYGDQGKFIEEFAKLVQLKLSTKAEFKGVVVKPAVSFDVSTTPVALEISFGHEDDLIFQGSPYRYSVMVKQALKIGPSVQAWRWIAKQIGVPAERAFIETIAPEVAATIAYWSGFVILAAGATVTVTCLFAWAIDHAHEVGDRMAAASWYARHYSDAVFDLTYTKLPPYFSDNGIGRKMIELAGQDLIADMRAQLIDVPPLNPVPYREDSPNFWWGAKQAILTYRRYVVAAANNNEYLARDRMTRAALNKAWAALGA